MAEVRKKVEAGHFGDKVRIPVAANDREAVGRMLGIEWELSGKPVLLGRLRSALAKDGADLNDVLTDVGGPLHDRPAEKQMKAQTRQHLRSLAAADLASAGIPSVVVDLALARRWLGTVEVAAEVARVVADVWAALPTHAGEAAGGTVVGLAEFAGRELRDPHALDRNQLLGRAMVRLLAATHVYLDHDEEPSSGRLKAVAAAAGRSLRASEWRATWARAGIVCDQVSSTVLVLNLPLHGGNPALAQVTAVRGEPLWVTARMTQEGCHVSSAHGAAKVVRVCENPSVIEAAAATLGRSCPPIVCLYGRPSSAGWAVLGAVADADASLLVSTDRDAAGQQIAAEVSRFVDRRAGGGEVNAWISGAPGLYEEERLEELLADLRRGQAHPE